MAACNLIDISDEEFMTITQSRDSETTTVKTVGIARPPPLPDNKEFHLFISHSNDTAEEINWAMNVVNIMENEFGFKCVLPSRDFKPGQEVISLITDGIVKSMKIVCVLTPDSLESAYCSFERRLAYSQSVKEGKRNIIPVLLKECQVPNIFKGINYIDVLQGENYIERIRRSFEENDTVAEVIPSVETIVQEIVEDARERLENRRFGRLSGHQYQIYGKKVRLRGAAWTFGRVGAYEENVLQQLKSPGIADLYNQARAIANNSMHLRFYSLTSDNFRTFITHTLLTLAISLPVFLAILVFKGNNLIDTSGGYTSIDILQVGLVFCLPGFFVLVFMICFHLVTFSIPKKKVLDLSLNQVLERNILVNYKRNICGPPSIQFMVYEIQPCLKFMTEAFLRRSNEEVTEELKEQLSSAAQKQILQYLHTNNDALFKWTSLPTSTVHRHPTFQSRACLCETLLGVHT